MTGRDSHPPVRAMFIPDDEQSPVEVGSFGLAALYGRLKGPSEVVMLGSTNGVLMCHAHGKVERLARNMRATELVDRFRPGYSRTDFIAGPAVVHGDIGVTDDGDLEDGLGTDVPAEIEQVAVELGFRIVAR